MELVKAFTIKIDINPLTQIPIGKQTAEKNNIIFEIDLLDALSID